MAYTRQNFKTLRELKAAVQKADVPVFNPGLPGPDVADGPAVIEGPQYPAAHKWYAGVQVKNGVIPKGSKVR